MNSDWYCFGDDLILVPLLAKLAIAIVAKADFNRRLTPRVSYTMLHNYIFELLADVPNLSS